MRSKAIQVANLIRGIRIVGFQFRSLEALLLFLNAIPNTSDISIEMEEDHWDQLKTLFRSPPKMLAYRSLIVLDSPSGPVGQYGENRIYIITPTQAMNWKDHERNTIC